MDENVFMMMLLIGLILSWSAVVYLLEYDDVDWDEVGR